MSIDVDFAAPGPGEWALDRSHYPGGTTPISQWLLFEGMSTGFGRVFAELGVPAERLDVRFVNGFMYSRLRPLIGADKPPRKPPPLPILWVATRLHPEFRRRTRSAASTLRDRPSNEVVARWTGDIRPRLFSQNRAFQAVDPVTLDDDALQRHIGELLDHTRDGFELHFWLHGHDLGPIARYLHAAIGWGLEPGHAIEALSGASPSTARPAERLVELRAIVESAEAPISSLDDIRALSDEAADLLEAHLADYGHVLATGYDLTASTLHELPETIIESIRTARQPPVHDHEAIATALRAQVPVEHRPHFDLLLGDARNVMDMRDDNGPVTVEWPVGLLRRAMLAAGDRLASRSSLHDPSHIFELSPTELRSLFSAGLPAADEIDRRASNRAAQAALDPPPTLGEPEPEPPLSALPKVLAELTGMIQTAIQYMGMAAQRDDEGDSTGLTGAGIGNEVYRGRACVTGSADDAIERLEPGDVLVVRATSPAFNSVLVIAGAVVTTDGGVLSHAAVMARELGIPAVIGASGALSIRDGSTVEVDPTAGRVRVLATP